MAPPIDLAYRSDVSSKGEMKKGLLDPYMLKSEKAQEGVFILGWKSTPHRNGYSVLRGNALRRCESTREVQVDEGDSHPLRSDPKTLRSRKKPRTEGEKVSHRLSRVHSLTGL
jgi:hypothetical protein